MNTPNFLNTFKTILLTSFISLSFILQAQTVHLISNPNGYDLDPYLPGGNFPIIYEGKLIFGAYDSNYNYYLAKSNGSAVTIINNPALYHPNRGPIVIFNNKLYCTFTGGSTLFQLAIYDGDSIHLINFSQGFEFNPNGGFSVYNGKLYFECSPLHSSGNYLAVLNGDSANIIDSLHLIDNTSSSSLIVYKNKLYFFTDSAGERLTSFDGENFKIISNPADVFNVYGNLIVYHNNLFFEGGVFGKGSFLMKYNGSNITTLPKPDSGNVGNASNNADEWNPFIDSIHHQLCFLFTQYKPTSQLHIAYYNDTTISLASNPDTLGLSQPFDNVFPVTFNNHIYILYKYNLAEYNGKSLSLIPNPGKYKLYYAPSIVFGNSLYLETQYNNVMMQRFDGTSMSIVPNTTGYINFPVIFNNNLYGFYYDTLKKLTQFGYLDTSSILLVKLLSFTAQKQSNTTLLQWQTANEVNNNYFNIERSADSKLFTSIGNKTATNNASKSNYSFVDNAPLAGINYYRLKQVDKDGKFSYSNIVSVDFSSNAAAFAVYPNPTYNSLNITIPSINKTSDIILYDATGKEVLHEQLASNITSKQINISKLPAGVYNMVLVQDGKQKTIKVVKK